MLALEMLLKEVFFRDASENLARARGLMRSSLRPRQE